MFESKKLFFTHPRLWDDPYETALNHKYTNNVFAQCWCRKGVSDAMWRIYSPDKLGVRIATTKDKLVSVLTKSKSSGDLGFRIEDVNYSSAASIQKLLKSTKQSLEKKFDIKTAVRPLFEKRSAFSHEEELRAVLVVKCNDPAVSAHFRPLKRRHTLVRGSSYQAPGGVA
jgi:hypothetical protein